MSEIWAGCPSLGHTTLVRKQYRVVNNDRVTKLMSLADNTYLTTLIRHPGPVHDPYHCEHCVQG